MRAAALLAIGLVCAAAPAAAQSGFEADRLWACPASGGELPSTCGAEIRDGEWLTAAGWDLAHHLLGVANPESATRWILEDRLDLRAALAYSPSAALRLSVGMSAAVWQRGEVRDDRSAALALRPAMGPVELALAWRLPLPRTTPLEIAWRTAVVLPTGAREQLTGDGRPGLRLHLLAAGRWWLLRPALALGVTSRDTVRFRDLTRDDALHLSGGVSLGPEGWPLRPFGELVFETRLAAPFANASDGAGEALLGATVPLPGGVDLQFACGFGMFGAGVPQVRGWLTARWRLGHKIPSAGE